MEQGRQSKFPFAEFPPAEQSGKNVENIPPTPAAAAEPQSDYSHWKGLKLPPSRWVTHPTSPGSNWEEIFNTERQLKGPQNIDLGQRPKPYVRRKPAPSGLGRDASGQLKLQDRYQITRRIREPVKKEEEEEDEEAESPTQRYEPVSISHIVQNTELEHQVVPSSYDHETGQTRPDLLEPASAEASHDTITESTKPRRERRKPRTFPLPSGPLYPGQATPNTVEEPVEESVEEFVKALSTVEKWRIDVAMSSPLIDPLAPGQGHDQDFSEAFDEGNGKKVEEESWWI